MPLESGAPTVNEVIEKLQGMGAGDLPLRVADYEGRHNVTVWSLRKNVVTDEDGVITDAYVVING